MNAAIVVLLLLLVGAIAYYIYARGRRGAPLASFQQLKKCTGQEQRLDLPMWYDDSVGEYMTALRLGSPGGQVATVKAVVDLGSTQLLVGSDQCGDCRKSDGAVPPSFGTDVSDGGTRTVRYAGGQVSVVRPTAAYLLDYRYLPGNSLAQTDGQQPGKEVYFGLIQSSSSDDASLNVLGLAGEADGFLAQLCGQKTVLLDFADGKLYIGNVDDLLPPNVQWFPLTRPTDGGIPYVLAPIDSFRVNGNPLPADVEPQNFLIDSGSTDSMVPLSLKSYFQNASTVQATFHQANGEPGASVSFSVPPDSIDYGSLPIARTILVGNSWMREYKYVVQYDEKRQAFFK